MAVKDGALYPGLSSEETEPECRWRLVESACCRYSMACEGVGMNCAAPESLLCEGAY